MKQVLKTTLKQKEIMIETIEKEIAFWNDQLAMELKRAKVSRSAIRSRIRERKKWEAMEVI